MVLIGYKLATPDVGWDRYDCLDKSVSYTTSSFKKHESPSESNVFYKGNLIYNTSVEQGTINFRITGSGLRLMFFSGRKYDISFMINVKIGNLPIESFDCLANGLNKRDGMLLCYEKKFPMGTYDVVLTKPKNTNFDSWGMSFDCFDVCSLEPSAELVNANININGNNTINLNYGVSVSDLNLIIESNNTTLNHKVYKNVIDESNQLKEMTLNFNRPYKNIELGTVIDTK